MAVNNKCMLDDVTILIKSFERSDCVNNLIKSIRKKYPCISIIVVDDGNQDPEFDKDDPNIILYKMDFDSGLSAGRNYGVSKINTEFFLLCDDDHIFTNDTNIEMMHKILTENSLDILGASIKNVPGGLNNWAGVLHFNKRILTAEKIVNRFPGELLMCDMVLNFFLARTESIKNHQWDSDLKLAEHIAFFFEHLGKLKIGFTDKCLVEHHRIETVNYNKYRLRSSKYFEMWKKNKNILEFISE